MATVHSGTQYLRFSVGSAAPENYLRLGSRADSAEDDLLASGEASASEGILLHSGGSYLVNIAGASLSTFANGLNDSITGDHTISIADGDFDVSVSNGKLGINVRQYAKFITGTGDITFDAQGGGYYKSDKRDTTTSEGDYFVQILGMEFGSLVGAQLKTASGVALSVSLFSITAKLISLSNVAMKFSFYFFSFSQLGHGMSAKLVGVKVALMDGKKVIYYLKNTPYQIYNTATKLDYKTYVTKKKFYKDKDAAAGARRTALGVFKYITANAKF